MELKIKLLDPGAIVPAKAHNDDAGFDLFINHRLEIAPGDRAMANTGVALEFPAGYAGFVQPKSGLAVKHGVTVLNTPGLIDAGYRGEVSVILVNLGTETVTFEKGNKIAQLVMVQLPEVSTAVVDDLSETKRGEGGFGSTGS